MVKSSLAALAVAMTFASSFAHAEDLGILIPETVEASIYGSTETVVRIPKADEVRSQTVAAVEFTQPVGAPDPSQPLDMTGADGTLRACYAAGGMASQSEDFNHYCNYEISAPGQSTASASTGSSSIVAQGVDTGYNGTNNIADEALMDCVSRGGSLIQLADNGQYACAM